MREESSIRIRKLTPQDAGKYKQIRLRAVEEHPEAFVPVPEEEREKTLDEVTKQFETVWNKDNNFILGAFAGEAIVGTVGFYQLEREKLRHKGIIWGVYVAPEYRRLKIGQMLMEEVLQACRKLPYLEQIQLSVAASNEQAKQLYDKLGFRTYGTEPRALRLSDRYLDEEHRILFLAADSGDS
jgi:ribosomal protein S18 acetylase RimI-like enzyme